MDVTLIRGWSLVILGLFLIGAGGVVSTFGWNRLGDRTKMRNLINSVVREWLINDALRSAIKSRAYIGGSGFAQRRYPMFKTTTLNGILISGLFESGTEKDVLLMRKVADYETAITEVNFTLEMLYSQFANEQDRNLVKQKMRDFLVRDQTFLNFERQHRRIKEILQENFSWLNLENTWVQSDEALSRDFMF